MRVLVAEALVDALLPVAGEEFGGRPPGGHVEADGDPAARYQREHPPAPLDQHPVQWCPQVLDRLDPLQPPARAVGGLGGDPGGGGEVEPAPGGEGEGGERFWCHDGSVAWATDN